MRRAGSKASNQVSRVHRRVVAAALSILALLALSGTVSAQTNIYQLRGSSDFGIYVYNTTANTETTVYKPYPINPGTANSAALAQRPSDGMLFYVMYTGGNNPIMFRFNPATPGVAPVQVGAGLGAAVPSSLRMAFSPTGTLYYLPDSRLLYTIDPNTGVATSTGVTVGAAITSGGDMAFSSAGTLYVVTSSKTLFTVSTATGTATQLGNAPINFPDPDPNATIGLAFDGAGRLLAQTQNANNIYSITLPVPANQAPQGVSVHAGDGDTASTGDMASASVPAPNLSITKTDGVTTVYRGGPVSYTIVVTNNGSYTVTGTVTDTVPASLTGVNWTCVASPGSFCAAASGSGNAINTSATLEAGDTAAYTVTGTVSAAASGTLTNQASVAVPSWLTDSNIADNTASDSDTINLNANLGITKTDGATTVNPGATVTYTVVVSNAGPDTANGAIVTDTVPASLSGVTWTCGSPVGGATCGAASGSGNSISTTANLPSGGSVTYTITGTLSSSATGTLSNTATVLTPASGVTDPNDPSRTGAANNSATDTTTINAVIDLTVAKSHTGNFTQGQNGATYTLTVSNIGNTATAGTITVTDTLPAGLSFVSGTGTGWNACTAVGQVVTCTRSISIPAVNSAPAITLTVNVSPTAPASVTNNVSVSGGGQTNTANDTASDATTINQLADLTIAKTHTGNFTQGQTNAPYTITVTNSGNGATSGTVTITDTLPVGLTFVSGSGTGWNACSAVGQVVTCTNTNTLNAGVSYSALTLNVNVATNAPFNVTNSVTVSGGGQIITTNDTATDPTTINGVPDLTVAKSHSGNFTQGQNGATYSITVTNSGTAQTSGTVTVTDNLPAGLTFVSGTGTGWNACTAVGQVVTCTNTNTLNAGVSYSVITLTVNVSATAPASVTNTVSVSGGGETNTGNDSASDATTINPVADLTIAKTHAGNFTRGSIGAYTITVTNSGAAATNGSVVTVTDTLPAGLSYSSFTGAGWTCSAAGQVVTCTRSNVLNPGVSYPVISINVSVAQNAASSVTNNVSVSGGGQANTANDTASDPTTIVSSSDLSLTKVTNNSGSGLGTNATFTITLTNSGPSDATNVAVRDQLPAGLTYVSSTPSVGAYNSGTGVWTVAALASGANATLQIVARIDALGAITNTAQVTASDQPDPDSTPNNNNAAEDDQASSSLSTSSPNVVLCKTIQGQACPPPATPSLPPGSDITYVITFTNSGGSYASSFIITDPVPTSTDFKVGSVTTSLGTTGLTVAIAYSNNGGTTWTYTPVSGAGGAPVGYDRNVTHVRWSFSGNLSQTSPNNTGSVGVTVRIQ